MPCTRRDPGRKGTTLASTITSWRRDSPQARFQHDEGLTPEELRITRMVAGVTKYVQVMDVVEERDWSRSVLATVRSLLMDRTTLEEHRDH